MTYVTSLIIVMSFDVLMAILFRTVGKNDDGTEISDNLFSEEKKKKK